MSDSEAVTPHIYNMPQQDPAPFDKAAFVRALMEQGVPEQRAWARAHLAEHDHQKRLAKP